MVGRQLGNYEDARPLAEHQIARWGYSAKNRVVILYSGWRQACSKGGDPSEGPLVSAVPPVQKI